jgi:hypothetical protein
MGKGGADINDGAIALSVRTSKDGDAAGPVGLVCHLSQLVGVAGAGAALTPVLSYRRACCCRGRVGRRAKANVAVEVGASLARGGGDLTSAW